MEGSENNHVLLPPVRLMADGRPAYDVRLEAYIRPTGLHILLDLPEPKSGHDLVALLERAADEVGLEHIKTTVCADTRYTPNGPKTTEKSYELEIYDRKLLGRLRGKLAIRLFNVVYNPAIRIIGYGSYACRAEKKEIVALADAFYRLAEEDSNKV